MSDEYQDIVRAGIPLADDAQEGSLRPQLLNEFLGQEEIKKNLSVFIQAARDREEALDHLFLIGPPGLGKTTLAQITAHELGADFKVTSAPALDKPKDLAGILSTITPRTVFFIDEIHRLKPAIEEMLYIAMEDYELDWVIGQGAAARTVRIPIPKFTLVGATTKAGMVSSPLISRFGIVQRFNYYNHNELSDIVKRSAKILDVKINDDASLLLAKCSRGTPRVANRVLRRMRDFAQIEGSGVITKEIAQEGLKRLGIDDLGLEKYDREILLSIINNFGGGPVGAETLAISIGESQDTLEDYYEPYLIQCGLIQRTPRGRIVTARAYEQLGLEIKDRLGKGGQDLVLKRTDFYFDLPAELIAQRPSAVRGQDRLMLLGRTSGAVEHHKMDDLPDLIEDGALMVFNNSRVRRARLFGVKETTGREVEFMFLNQAAFGEGCVWNTMVKNAKKQKAGMRYQFPDGSVATILDDPQNAGTEFRLLKFAFPITEEWFEKNGHIPLPPYIKRDDEAADGERYQNVYADQTGSAACPTAGLHFTEEMLGRLSQKGVERVFVTLHVGLGTFLPVREDQIEDHKMHEEIFTIEADVAQKINQAKKDGRPILAVGTTSVRTLESAANETLAGLSGANNRVDGAGSNGADGLIGPGTRGTSIFMYPGYQFKVVDQMFTNFHTPESTLIMLVSAFAGRENILAAYQEAVRERYRFFSYGDCMLIK